MIYVLGNGYVGSGFGSLGCLGEVITTDADGSVVSKLGRKYLGVGDVVINCVGRVGCLEVGYLSPLMGHEANVFLPLEVSGICDRAGCKMIHFSSALAGEYDLYSRQKAYVDYILPLINNNYTIYKLSWLFGGSCKGGDFVSKTIQNLRQGISVPVYDELGSPTYIKDVVEYVINNLNNHKNETVELANKGKRIRSGLVRDIARHLGVEAEYHIVNREYPHKYDCSLNGELRPYEQALEEYLCNMNGENVKSVA